MEFVSAWTLARERPSSGVRLGIPKRNNKIYNKLVWLYVKR